MFHDIIIILYDIALFFFFLIIYCNDVETIPFLGTAPKIFERQTVQLNNGSPSAGEPRKIHKIQ